MDSRIRDKKRALGQNFLIDSDTIESICSTVPAGPEDAILEIGPGYGALTQILQKKCGQLLGLEIDSDCVKRLEKKVTAKNARIVKGDASRVAVEDLLGQFSDAKHLYLVGNLPYNHVGPILRNFFPYLNRFKSCQFMVQYEVGKRMVANPGKKNFGSLSVFVQNYSEAKINLVVPPQVFRPVPKIHSAVVEFIPRKNPLNGDPLFERFTKLAFSQKRKKIVNCLGREYGRQKILMALEKAGIQENARAEEIGVEQLDSLFRSLK